MKIPKRIDEILTRRRKYAEKLNALDNQLSDWLERKGITDTACLDDCIRTGCMMYCEPSSAEFEVRKAISDFKEQEEK